MNKEDFTIDKGTHVRLTGRIEVLATIEEDTTFKRIKDDFKDKIKEGKYYLKSIKLDGISMKRSQEV